ncbi:hypothetical protein F5Y09DRAFT_345629 [Xylaria sp. FL1042]|nr:hypothetical protein F5Y09DRAFT_345629 [Xylaria sp. FL1042]
MNAQLKFYVLVVLGPHSITISNDLSHSSKVEERQLLALRTNITLPRARVTFYPIPIESPLNDTLSPWFREERLRVASNLSDESEEADESVTMGAATASSNSELTATEVTDIEDERYVGKRTHREYRSNIELDNKTANLDLVELQNYIMRLEQRAKDLGASGSHSRQTYFYYTLHRISEFKESSNALGREKGVKVLKRVLSPPYFDAPEWVGSTQNGTLRCRVPVKNFDLYVEKNKDLSFIIYKTYILPEPGHQIAFLQHGETPNFEIHESIQPITGDLMKAVEALLGSKDEYSELWQVFKDTNKLNAPYLCVYHQRKDWDSLRGDLAQSSEERLMMLWNYIIQSYDDEYAAADKLVARKVISKYIQYMFKPGDILAQCDGETNINAERLVS